MIASILAALLAVFTLASSASADCAWLLWIATSGVPTDWMTQAAFTSQQPCMSEARRLARVGLHAPDEALDDPVGAVVILKTKQGQIEKTLNYECWPDTVDPRKARGSGR